MTDKPNTPSTEHVRFVYSLDGADREYKAQGFDRWLDQVRAEAKAEALRDFADAHRVPFIMFQGDNYVVTVSDLLRGQARTYLGEPDEYSKGKL